MINLIVYDKIEKKNIIERDYSIKLSPVESLAHSLNVMDFMSSFNKGIQAENDEIEWIVLQLKST